ncbi:MAG: divalent-cation tolerance protein CutA [Myxococcota bacterium]
MHVVLCNCSPAEAASLARTLVEERLCACVNRLNGVTSTYRWQGELHEDPETTLIIKVAEGGVQALRDRLVALHSYDVPEVLVLPVDASLSHAPYVDWVQSHLRRPE